VTGGGQTTVIATAAALIAIVSAANAFGVTVSGRMQLVLSALLVTLLLAAVLASAPHARTTNLHPFAPHGWLAVGQAAALLVWSFAGWEAITHLAAEFRRPAHDMPRSAGIAVVVVGLLYLSVAAASVMVLGPSAGASGAPLAELIAGGIGGHAQVLATAAALLLTLGTMNAYFAGAAKLGAALGRDGALPGWLAQGSQVGGVPRRSLAAVALAATTLAGVGPTPLVLVTSGCFVMVYGLGAAAALKLLPRGSVAYRCAWISLIAVAGLFVTTGWYVVCARSCGWRLAACGLRLAAYGSQRRARVQPRLRRPRTSAAATRRFARRAARPRVAEARTRNIAHRIDQRARDGRRLRVGPQHQSDRLVGAGGRQRQTRERAGRQIVLGRIQRHEPHRIVLERERTRDRHRQHLDERIERRRAARTEQLLGRLANQRAVRRQHDRIARELGGGRGAREQRMAGAHDRDERLVVQLLERKPDHALGLRQAPDRAFDRAGLQPFEQFRIGRRRDPHDDARPACGQRLHQCRRERRGDGRQHADLERRGSRAALAREQADALPQCEHARVGMRHEELRFARRLRAVPAALEQLHAENALQLGDRLRYGRLRDRQAFRGLLHAAQLRDREKALQMPELDAAVRDSIIHNRSLCDGR